MNIAGFGNLVACYRNSLGVGRHESRVTKRAESPKDSLLKSGAPKDSLLKSGAVEVEDSLPELLALLVLLVQVLLVLVVLVVLLVLTWRPE